MCNKCDNSVQFVAKLLKVDPSALKMALTTRLMSQVKQLGGLNASDIKYDIYAMSSYLEFLKLLNMLLFQVLVMFSFIFLEFH